MIMIQITMKNQWRTVVHEEAIPLASDWSPVECEASASFPWLGQCFEFPLELDFFRRVTDRAPCLCQLAPKEQLEEKNRWKTWYCVDGWYRVAIWWHAQDAGCYQVQQRQHHSKSVVTPSFQPVIISSALFFRFFRQPACQSFQPSDVTLRGSRLPRHWRLVA